MTPVPSQPSAVTGAVPAAPVDAMVLDDAVAILRRGGLVAFPTETVYGLGGNALDPRALARIFGAKGRPADNPLIAHVADADVAARLVGKLTPLAAFLARRWWPGPLTLVVPAREEVPRSLTAGLDTVAVRCPDHPIALQLLEASGMALAAPSANRSGRPSPTTAEHVRADLDGAVDLVIDGGPSGYGLESTVVDARGDVPVVLRDGALTREELGVEQHASGGPLHRSPGTRHRHYAPRCPLEILPACDVARRAARLTAGGKHVGAIVPHDVDAGPAEVLARYRSTSDLARQLFAALRAADEVGCDMVLAAAVTEVGLGRAVMDRLRRAGGLID